MDNIRHFKELDVYQLAIEAAMDIFELTKRFPVEEWYSLTDPVKRRLQSVCANIAEAWRKRCYPAAFVSKLFDAEAEATETEVWLELSVLCGDLDQVKAAALEQHYEPILGKLVNIISHPDQWTIRSIREEEVDYARFPASPTRADRRRSPPDG